MGLLFKTRSYLVGPMENLDGTQWRTKVENALSPREVVIYNPYHKPFIRELDEGPETRKKISDAIKSGDLQYSHDVGKQIRSYDLNLVDRSDFIIANIHPTIASYGSMEELTTANRAKKPIFLAIKGGRTKCPMWITWMIPPKYIYDNVEDILEILFNIDDGKIIPDSDRWRLLRPELR